jgi:hypothetical protein
MEAEIIKIRIEGQQKEAIARKEANAMVSDLEKKADTWQAELKRCKADAELEKKHIQEQHGAELAAVSTKVKALIEGKEQTIQALKEQLGVAQTRLREVEQLFHQQKKAILGATTEATLGIFNC